MNFIKTIDDGFEIHSDLSGFKARITGGISALILAKYTRINSINPQAGDNYLEGICDGLNQGAVMGVAVQG